MQFKRKTRPIAIIAALVMIFTMLVSGAQPVHAGTIVESGTAGTCKWELDERGILTLFGDNEKGGKTPDYDWREGGGPWCKYKDKIKIVICDNVTEIGDYAFYSCNNVGNVTISSKEGLGVERIGYHAFYGCYGLDFILINGNNCVIEEGAFEETFGKSAQLHLSGIKTIGESAFNEVDCWNLEFDNTLEYIGVNAFCLNEELESVIIPSSCKKIDKFAFRASCDKSPMISILNPNCSIHDEAFDKGAILGVIKNSTAHKYAEKFGFKYFFIGDQGSYTVDFTKGDFSVNLSEVDEKFKITDEVVFYSTFSMLFGELGCDRIKITFVEEKYADLDLDYDGIGDIRGKMDEKKGIFSLELLPGRSGIESKTIKLLPDEIKIFENSGMPYYSTITFKLPKKEVVPTGIKLNKTDIQINRGETLKLTATVSPSNAANKAITWSSSDSKVASVDKNGNVKGIKQGLVNVTATTKEGKKKAVAKVRVHFDDVKKDNTFYNPIYWAADKGVTIGVAGTNKFAPSDNVTRGQVVAFLYRMAGNPSTAGIKNNFKDVTDKSTFYKPILWGAKNNIVEGYSDGTFRESGTCTRGQIVTFLWRMAGKPEPKAKKSPFKDIDSKNSFYKAILWAAEKGITTGYDDGTFRSGGNCTRGQIVAFLQRFAKQYPSKVKL